ncbi:MAG: DNA/RNA non-specific endonuclease [Spirochaetes bacterium]|nr:MAG: DNA/RNA non-specific endonuclease [Spirochaetota bacterium]
MKELLYSLIAAFLSLFHQIPDGLEIPAVTNPEAVIEHTNYTLQYDERYEQADWVAYELTASEVEGTVKRGNHFREDPYVVTGSAELSDYKKSGFDRGHLAPAGDMKFSGSAMDESFYLSNMSPQRPGFNRGIWKELEEMVRTWAEENGSLYVVTGPVLNKPYYQTIGENKVAVPEFYYKVLLDYKEPEIKGIGFILPNKKCDDGVENYAVTIDKVEEVTGIDFFPKLPDAEEEKIESESELSLWNLFEKK